MTAKTLEFNGCTTLDLPPEKVLVGAKHKNLSEVVVIGIAEDLKTYVSASMYSAAEVVFMLEKAKHYIMGLDSND